MYYGPLIKKLRKAKNITQKEVYSGIVSRSFYLKFEKGDYSIEVMKFTQLLARLNLSYQEFLYFFQTEYLTEPADELQKVLTIYYRFDLTTLAKLKAIYTAKRASDLSLDRLIGATAYALAYSLDPTLSPQPLAYLREYLVESKSLSLIDLKIFVTTCFIFSAENSRELEEVFVKAVDSIKVLWQVNPELLADLIGSLYVNLIQLLLANNEQKQAYHLAARFEEFFSAEQLSLTTRLYFDFFGSWLVKDQVKFQQTVTIFKNYAPEKWKLLQKIVESNVID